MRELAARIVFLLIMLLIASPTTAWSVEAGHVGIRAGVGTDIEGGLAYGVGLNYLLLVDTNALELGIQIFGGSFEETTDEGIHTYEETTDIFVFGLMANYLAGYRTDKPSTFFVAGFGLGSISVEWEERSATDTSLGPPLPGGGSMQSEDGSAGGSIFNIGVGRSFGQGFDARLEIPVIVTFSAPGEASSVVPAATITLGKRF